MSQNSPSFNRDPRGKFDPNSSFVSVKAGTDGYLLEDEFNEMQWIQNEARASMFRNLTRSGFLNQALFDFSVNHNQPDNMGTFSIYSGNPLSVNVYGYELRIGGNDVVNRGVNTPAVDPNRLLIELPAPPTTDTRTDLVFLEAWFQEVSGNDTLKQFGGVDGPQAANLIMDTRVGFETTRRVQLRWRVRAVPNATTLTGVYALDVHGNSTGNTYPYAVSANDLGAYVTGTPTSQQDLGTVDGFMYAIPICTVNRLNASMYDANINPNGAWAYTIANITANLAPGTTTIPVDSGASFAYGQGVIIGDTQYTITAQPGLTSIQVTPGLTATIMAGGKVYSATSGRPDNMYNNVIYPSQVTDLRFFTRPSTVDAEANSGVSRDGNAGILANYFQVNNGNNITASGTSLILNNASAASPLFMQFGGSGTQAITFLHNGQTGTISTSAGELHLSSATGEVEVVAQYLDVKNVGAESSLRIAENNALSNLPKFNPGMLYVNALPFGNQLLSANPSGTTIVGDVEVTGNLKIDNTSTFVGDVTVEGALNVENIQGVKGLVTTAMVGQPNGVAPLNAQGFIPTDSLSVNGLVDGPNLTGIAHFENNLFTTRGLEGSFIRNSIAYNPDTMLQVQANAPRYVQSHIGHGILIEEGSQQLLLNSDLETVTTVSIAFQDQLQFNTAWTVQGGSVTFSTNGATFTSKGWITTNPNITWAPMTGTDGSNLKLSTTGSFITATIMSKLDLYLAKDISNYYFIEVNYNNTNAVSLCKSINGVVTVLASQGFNVTADSEYTLQLMLDVNGNLQASVYAGLTATGTALVTLNAVDTSIQGHFMAGLGGDNGVIANEATVMAPVPSIWDFSKLSNENYVALASFAKSGSTSLHFLGSAAGSFSQKVAGLTPAQIYNVSAYVYMVSGQMIMQVGNDNNTSALGGYTGAGATGTPQWVRITQAFTADNSGIADVTFNPYQYPCEFYIDAIQLEPKTYATSYIRNDSIASGTTVTRQADQLSYPGSLFSTAAGSVAFWINPYVGWQYGIAPDHQDWFWMIGNGQYGTNNEFRLAWNQGYIKYGIGTQQFTQYLFTPPTNQFTHVALTWDTTANISTLYVNGVVVASGTAGAFTNDTVYLGRDSNNNYFANAIFEELAFFKTAITSQEVNRMYVAKAPMVDAYISDAITIQGTPLQDLVQLNQANNQPVYFEGSGLLVDWYNVDNDGSLLEDGTGRSYGQLIKREVLTNLSLNNYAPNGVTNNYYGRAYGYITAPTTDTYTFTLISDDGSRLYIDGTEVVSNWHTSSVVTASGNIALKAGYVYPIMIEFFKGNSNSQLNVNWSSSTMSTTTIPNNALAWADPWYGGFEVEDNLLLHNNLLVENNATVNNNLTVNGATTLNDLTVGQNATVNGTLDVTGTGNHTVAGQLTLNGTQPMLRISNNGVMGAPSAMGNTFKVLTSDDGTFKYGIGVDTNAQWYIGNQYHRWYDGTYTKQMELNNSNLWVNGTITSASGTSSFTGLNTATANVTSYVSNGFVVGNKADLGANNYAVGIAAPSGAGTAPFGITVAGTQIMKVDTAGAMTFANGLKVTSPSGTSTLTADNSGNVVVYGNLVVQGTTTTVDSSSYNLGTQWIDLNENETGTPTQPAGLRIHRGTSPSMILQWNEAGTNWTATDVNSNNWPIILDNGNVTFSNKVNMTTLNATGSGTFGNMLVVGSAYPSGSTTVTSTLYGATLMGNTTDNYLRVLSANNQQYIEAQSGMLNITGANNTVGTGLVVNFSHTTFVGGATINGTLQVGAVGTDNITYVQDLHVQAANTAASGSVYSSSRWLFLDGSYWNGSSAITQGFVLSAGDTISTAPTSFFLKYNNNGTASDVMKVDSSGNLTTYGTTLSIANGGFSFLESDNAALAYGTGGTLTVGTQSNWDYSGGVRANVGLSTLDIGTADQLGLKNVNNVLTGGIRLMNDTQVMGTLTVNNTNNPTNVNTSSLWVGQNVAGGAYVEITNSTSTNYIESYNNAQNANADLRITGANGNQGSNLYLNFSRIYDQGDRYAQNVVLQNNYKLFFGTNTATDSGADNSDPIYIYRTDDATNSTGLHLVLGDETGQPNYLQANGTGDYFSIELAPNASGTKLFAVTSPGDAYVNHNLTVGGELFIGDPMTAVGTHAALSANTGTNTLLINPNGNFAAVNLSGDLTGSGNLTITGGGATIGNPTTGNEVNVVGTGDRGYQINGSGTMNVYPGWGTTKLFVNTTSGVEGATPSYTGGVESMSHFTIYGGNLSANTVSIPSSVAASAAASGNTNGQLAGSTTYYYTVTAITADGETPQANVTSVNTATTAHPITVTWLGVWGATGYKVYRGIANNALYYLATVGIATSYVDDGTAIVSTSVQPPTVNTTGGLVQTSNLTLSSPVAAYASAARIQASSGTYIDLKPGVGTGVLVRSATSDGQYVSLNADSYTNSGFIGYNSTTNGMKFDASGNFTLTTGNLILSSGTITVNSGDIHVTGKYVQVHRRPLFGWASTAGAYETNSATYNALPGTLYEPFGQGAYGLPSVDTGATRWYRLYAVWSDNIQPGWGLNPYLSLVGVTNQDTMYEWQMSSTWGDATGMSSRDGYSPYFQVASSSEHANLQMMINNATKSLSGTAPDSASVSLMWVELIAYDVY